MKMTVIGLGLIGSQVVRKLTAAGHEVGPAAPSTGVDLLTGEGLAQALDGAEGGNNIATPDVVDAIVKVATGTPLQGIWNVAGPDVFSLDELGRVTLAAHHDKRTVITDEKAGVFAGVAGDALTAGPGVHLAPTHYRDW